MLGSVAQGRQVPCSPSYPEIKRKRPLSIARTASHMPGLRRLPAAKLLALAEIALLAREHATRLDPQERRRFLALIRRGRGRTSKLSARERAELMALVAKAN